MTPALRFSAILPADPRTGFELGREHARHGVSPAAELLARHAALREGWEAGRRVFEGRTRPATSAVRQWLALRTGAWLQARHFDTLTATPHYLAQLAGSHCPVTREALSPADPTTSPAPAVIERVYEDAGYAAGNLACLSRRAVAAKAGLSCEDALENVRQIDAQGLGTIDGLNALQWARLAVLVSMATPLPHARAASLPLLVLPPNRLHLVNPIQGVQALVTMQLLRSGWSQRITAFEALLPTAALRRELHAFFGALVPKVVAAGRHDDPRSWRWSLEDAWRHPQVQQRWRHFALQLDARQAQVLLDQAVEQGLCSQRARAMPDGEATAGWQLATRGYFEPTGRPTLSVVPLPQLLKQPACGSVSL